MEINAFGNIFGLRGNLEKNEPNFKKRPFRPQTTPDS